MLKTFCFVQTCLRLHVYVDTDTNDILVASQMKIVVFILFSRNETMALLSIRLGNPYQYSQCNKLYVYLESKVYKSSQ